MSIWAEVETRVARARRLRVIHQNARIEFLVQKSSSGGIAVSSGLITEILLCGILAFSATLRFVWRVNIHRRGAENAETNQVRVAFSRGRTEFFLDLALA